MGHVLYFIVSPLFICLYINGLNPLSHFTRKCYHVNIIYLNTKAINLLRDICFANTNYIIYCYDDCHIDMLIYVTQTPQVIN